MIRIVTARRLAGTAAELASLRARLERAQAEAKTALDREVAEHLRLRTEANQAHRDRDTALYERDVANSAAERGPRNSDLEPSETALNAAAYEQLRDAIFATMTDPNEWDGDGDEGTLLARYVRHLAERGRRPERTETEASS